MLNGWVTVYRLRISYMAGNTYAAHNSYQLRLPCQGSTHPTSDQPIGHDPTMPRRTERERFDHARIDGNEPIAPTIVSLVHMLELGGSQSGLGDRLLVDTYRQLSRDLQLATDQQTIHHMVVIESELREREIDPDAIVRDLWTE